MARVVNKAIQDWLGAQPGLGEQAEADCQSASDYLRRGADLLHALRPKWDRSQDEAATAQIIHAASREVRKLFLAFHAEWLYSVLTKRHTVRKSIHEVALGAAECCPGLVPSLQQSEQEQGLPQKCKEGYEIDQGILFQALLGSMTAGRHLVDSARLPTQRAGELLEVFRKEGALDLGAVSIERRGMAAHITINNPSCLNAEDEQLVDDMETAIDLTLLDQKVRVGVLRGGAMTHPRYTGQRVFSAGINLKALQAGKITLIGFLLRRELSLINKIAHGLFVDTATFLDGCLQKPWIAAVDGFAIGGGAQLLLVFDYVIAARDSYISLPAAQEGIVPGFANLRLTRCLGSRRARQLLLTGRKIRADEADALLLVDEVVEPDAIAQCVEHRVDQLGASPSVIANRHMLNLAEEPLEHFLEYAAMFSRVQAERLFSEDVLDKKNRWSYASS